MPLWTIQLFDDKDIGLAFLHRVAVDFESHRLQHGGLYNLYV